MAGTVGSVGSLGGRAWLVSAVLHGSIAAALVAHAVPPSPPVMQLVDIQTALPVAPPPAPPPTPLPELPRVAPPPLSKVPPARATSPARAVASAQTKAPPGVAQPEGDVPEVVSAPTAPPTFVMALPVGSSLNAKAAPARDDEVVDEKGVSSRAEVAYGPVPVYPAAARAAQIELDVPVEIVVSPAGNVVDARILHHVGYGLDEATIEAIRSYRFTPAQRDGHAVAVRMRWTMQFRLQ